MSLFAIADLHLSLGTDKPMDVFKGWNNYIERIEANWNKLVKPEDTVVIAGDISWSMKLENCYDDFSFLHSLPGTKIILKGNHDYWWATKKKIDEFLQINKFDSIKVLFNNAYAVENYAICGSRGWFIECDADEDIKVLNREVGRISTSICEAKKFDLEPIVFLHYPPVYGGTECSEIVSVLEKNNIKKCYYGHLHGTSAVKYALNGKYNGIEYRLIACDFVNFTPVLIR